MVKWISLPVNLHWVISNAFTKTEVNVTVQK